MHKPKKKREWNKIFGVLTFILSVILLIVFILLATSDRTLTENLYAAEILTFIFGSLGLIAAIGLFFEKNLTQK